MSARGQQRRLFAIDHNFPEPILEALGAALPMAELVPVRRIRPDLAEVDDWQLMLELFRDERQWDGLITNDDKMLWLAKEMTVLSQTGLTLVVVKGDGDNPVRATGALLCHLAHICHHTTPGQSQIWRLRVSNKEFESAHVYLDKIAERRRTTIGALFEANKVPSADLRRRGPG